MLNLKKKEKKTYLPTQIEIDGWEQSKQIYFKDGLVGSQRSTQQMGKKIRCYPQTFCSLCPMHCILFFDNHIADFGVAIFTLLSHFVYIYANIFTFNL